MGYALYTTNGIFADERVNVICNVIMNALENEFEKGTLDTMFGITGSVAKFLQEETPEAVKCVAFVTDDDAVYKYLAAQIKKLIGATGAAIFDNRIQVVHPIVYLEFWKASSLTLVNVDGIYAEDIEDIPAYIL